MSWVSNLTRTIAAFNQQVSALARGQDSPLYALHPELATRQPIFRMTSDGEGADTQQADDEQHYIRNVWVRKAVNVLQRNLAPQIPQVVTGKGREMTTLENHPLSMLLQNPNPELDPATLWEEWTAEMCLSGEVGHELVKSKSGRNLLEIWPREADTFTVRAMPGSERYRTVESYRIDDEYTVPPAEFIHYKFYNPENQWRGLSLISAVRMGVQIDELAQAWSYLFFKNQARPDYALIAPQGLTKDERDEYKLQLRMEHGFPNVHEPIILEQGVVDVKALSFQPKDMEWVAQRELSRDEIGAIFGVPDEIMGWGRDTYENFATAEKVLWTLTLIPLLNKRDRQLTHHFKKIGLLKPAERIDTDLSGVASLQEDLTEKISQMQIMFQSGVPLNVINDRLGLGLPSIKGGDVGYISSALVPIGEPRPQPTPSPTLAPDVPNDNQPDNPTDTPDNNPDDQPQQRSVTKAFPAYGSQEHEKMWQTKQANLDKPVNSFVRGLKKYFQDQQNNVVRALRNSKEYGRGKWKGQTKALEPADLFDEEAEAAEFERRFRKEIREVFDAAALRELMAYTQEDFPTLDPSADAVAAIRTILETVAKKVNNTTWLDLIDILQDAEREGLGIPAIQELLNNYFEGRKSDYQTERIARTTMTGADNAGTMAGWEQSGVVKGKTWLSALAPNRTRDEHAAAHGQTVKLFEKFDVGGEKLEYPGDPIGAPGNIINCLCSMTAEV